MNLKNSKYALKKAYNFKKGLYKLSIKKNSKSIMFFY